MKLLPQINTVRQAIHESARDVYRCIYVYHVPCMTQVAASFQPVCKQYNTDGPVNV